MRRRQGFFFAFIAFVEPREDRANLVVNRFPFEPEHLHLSLELLDFVLQLVNASVAPGSRKGPHVTSDSIATVTHEIKATLSLILASGLDKREFFGTGGSVDRRETRST